MGGWWPGDWARAVTTDTPTHRWPRRRLPSPRSSRVINSDGQGRMTTAEAPADYSYVKGCHAIANGYHCDTPTATP